jgi:hypothetical protein
MLVRPTHAAVTRSSRRRDNWLAAAAGCDFAAWRAQALQRGWLAAVLTSAG